MTSQLEMALCDIWRCARLFSSPKTTPVFESSVPTNTGADLEAREGHNDKRPFLLRDLLNSETINAVFGADLVRR